MLAWRRTSLAMFVNGLLLLLHPGQHGGVPRTRAVLAVSAALLAGAFLLVSRVRWGQLRTRPDDAAVHPSVVILVGVALAALATLVVGFVLVG